MPYTAKRYQDAKGKIPYTDWIKKLRKKDIRAAAKIDFRVARTEAGNFGDHKFERDGDHPDVINACGRCSIHTWAALSPPARELSNPMRD